MSAQDNQTSNAATSLEDRRFCRGDVAITAQIRAFGGVKHQVKIVDISATGFRMESLTYLSNDQVIFLTMPGFQQMEATIIWQTEWMYGCKFARPLYPAVYEHIVSIYPSMFTPATTSNGFLYAASLPTRRSRAQK